MSSLAGQVPERAQAWCEDVGSPAVAAAVEEWALWFPTELMLERGELEGLAADTGSVVEALRGTDAELARASGHSYGSTVVALGLGETDAFDAFIASGSPGFGAKDSLDMQIPDGQVYVSYYDMPGDLVAASGAHGDRPQTLPGVTVTDNSPRTVTFADGSREEYIGPGDTWYWQHSDYWDKERASLFNQAAITVGREDMVATR